MLERAYRHVPAMTDQAGVVNAIIEIPRGRRTKFEIDKKTGLFRMDRYLYSSSHYPGDYGFLPCTLAEDGDPLDILVMVNEPTFTGCLIEARLVGFFHMHDRGENDHKLLAVPDRDPLFSEYRDLEQVPPHFLKEVSHFFSTYKQLEGAEVEVLGWSGAADALAETQASMRRYAEALERE